MKAIQIKYIAATNHKGYRYKAFTKHSSLTKERPSDMEDRDFVLLLANELAKKLEWEGRINGIALLPNGDYVATLGG